MLLLDVYPGGFCTEQSQFTHSSKNDLCLSTSLVHVSYIMKSK